MEETAEATSPTSCSQQGQLWDQTMLFKVLSSLALKTFKDGVNAVSLGSVFQYWIFQNIEILFQYFNISKYSSYWKIFSLYPDIIPLASMYSLKSYPPMVWCLSPPTKLCSSLSTQISRSNSAAPEPVSL